MNEIANLCKAVAVVSVISGVITALLPESKLKRSVNTLSAIVVIYAFIFGFADINADFKIISESTEAESLSVTDNSVTDILIELSEKELKKTVEKIITDKGFHGICEVELIYEENNSIKEIIKISGEFDKTDKEAIKAAVESGLERSVDIEFRQ